MSTAIVYAKLFQAANIFCQTMQLWQTDSVILITQANTEKVRAEMINPSDIKVGNTITIKVIDPTYKTEEVSTYTVKKITHAGNFKVTHQDGWDCTLKSGFFASPNIEILEIA